MVTEGMKFGANQLCELGKFADSKFCFHCNNLIRIQYFNKDSQEIDASISSGCT